MRKLSAEQNKPETTGPATNKHMSMSAHTHPHTHIHIHTLGMGTHKHGIIIMNGSENGAKKNILKNVFLPLPNLK